MPLPNSRVAAASRTGAPVPARAPLAAVLLGLGAAGLLAGCQRQPVANPHYVLGAPYQSGGTWWYPRETHNLDETGLAEVYPDDHPGLTTDGEVFGQGALTAAHATIQLPAIARLTDLQTGRSLLVRINDRGTPAPSRLVQVTRQVAALLGMPPDSVAQVRLQVLAGPSEAAERHVPGTPALPIASAPLGSVTEAALAPLPGARQEAGHSIPATAQPAGPADFVPDSVPEVVTQGAPRPGRLFVRLDTFQSYQYAAVERARLIGLSPHIDTMFQGREESFRVMIGPLGSVAAADAAVDQAVRAGIVDARVVVE